MKIKELVQGNTATLPLVVTKVTARETRAKKPYLNIEFYDGIDSISGNYWDWSGKNMPAKNAILDVTAQLTEYMGVPQLNIKSLRTNNDLHISSFTPSNGQDIGATYLEAYRLVSDIKDDFLRELTLNILEHLKHQWITVPAAVKVHHAFAAGTLIHSLSVAKIAKNLANDIDGAFCELCFIGGLLHDVGKLFSYHIDGVVCELTDVGMLLDHTFIGAQFVVNFAEELSLLKGDRDDAKLDLLTHIILSHHGKLEYGAAVPPSSIEAHIVHHADALDSAIEQIRVESNKTYKSMWTERIWPLSNRPHITTQYTQAVFRTEQP